MVSNLSANSRFKLTLIRNLILNLGTRKFSTNGRGVGTAEPQLGKTRHGRRRSRSSCDITDMSNPRIISGVESDVPAWNPKILASLWRHVENLPIQENVVRP